MTKKCPFLKLGAVPVGKINQEMQLAVGLCMGEECALYIVKEDGVIDRSECAFVSIAKNSML